MTCTALNFRHRLSRIIPCIRSRTAEASGVPGAIMQAPAMVKYADFLICESTYGDRRHDTADPERKLADVVNLTIARGGSVIVPSFAVGRAQALMHLVERLKAGSAIPSTRPVYLNSPMAIDVTTLCQRFIADHRLTADECAKMCAAAKIVNSVDESKALNASSWPKLIIAGSGMATGGRVLHHLRAYAPDPRSTILLTGVPSRGYAWPRAAGRRAINQAVRRIRAGPRGNRVARQPVRACRLRRDSRLASQLRARAADDLRHARRAGCR
jgi:metallo-beta-lactamase family protein